MPGSSGEQALIARIRERLPAPPAWVRIGIGDDAAVVEAERNTLEVLTTDTLVEGIHWDPRFCSPADIGHKSLAVNLSDVAAMGGSPRAALLSLSVPASWADTAAEPFVEAFVAHARDHDVAVVGGNVTSSPGPVVISVTLTASVRPRRVMSRSGGRSGDDLYVTGQIGAALAGLMWLRDHPTLDQPDDPGLAACVARYRRPEARIRIGLLAARNRVAGACMDLSDGLADAVRQVAAMSGTGARIDAGSLPIPEAALKVFQEWRTEPVRAAAAGGDDYELLLAVSPKKRRALEAVARMSRGVPITRIGELTADRALRLARSGHEEEGLPEGFAHF
jgi:thiamine-monophosphate kinase